MIDIIESIHNIRRVIFELKKQDMLMATITLCLMTIYLLLHDFIETQAPWLFWVYLSCTMAFSGYIGGVIYLEKYLLQVYYQKGNLEDAIQFPKEVIMSLFMIGDYILKQFLFFLWQIFFDKILVISKIIFYLGITHVLVCYLKKLKGIAISIIATYVLEKYFPNLSEIQHICWDHVFILTIAFAVLLMMFVVYKMGKEDGLKESDKILETFEKRKNYAKQYHHEGESAKYKYKESDFNCKICLTEKAICFGQNCLHLVSCQDCVQDLEDKCPVCRNETEFISLYI